MYAFHDGHHISLSFLKDRERLLEWVETLKKHTVTTKLIIIGNVSLLHQVPAECPTARDQSPPETPQWSFGLAGVGGKDDQEEPPLSLSSCANPKIQQAGGLGIHCNISEEGGKGGLVPALLTLEKDQSRENLERFYRLLHRLHHWSPEGLRAASEG